MVYRCVGIGFQFQRKVLAAGVGLFPFQLCFCAELLLQGCLFLQGRFLCGKLCRLFICRETVLEQCRLFLQFRQPFCVLRRRPSRCVAHFQACLLLRQKLHCLLQMLQNGIVLFSLFQFQKQLLQCLLLHLELFLSGICTLLEFCRSRFQHFAEIFRSACAGAFQTLCIQRLLKRIRRLCLVQQRENPCLLLCHTLFLRRKPEFQDLLDFFAVLCMEQLAQNLPFFLGILQQELLKLALCDHDDLAELVAVNPGQ